MGQPVVHAPTAADERIYSTPSMQRGGLRTTVHPHGTDAPIDTDRVILWPDTFNNHVAALGTDAEEALLRRMGVDAEVMDAGCCGLAGSFGFSASKYDVSVRVGERKMAPRIRAASADTQIVTDGFSCREQIQHLTDRQPRHLAELFRDAIRAQQAGSPD